MPSSATLSTLRDRVEALLYDSTNVVWSTGTIDEGLRLALEEYSRARPYVVWGTVTPAASTREVSLSALTGLVDVVRVWFPYTASAPEYPPRWVDAVVWWESGTPYLWLDVASAPNGTDVARIVYTKAHALKDLDGASASTFPAADDGLLVLGGAGYAALSREADAVDTEPRERRAPDDYQTLSSRLLAEFRRRIRQSSRDVRYGV